MKIRSVDTAKFRLPLRAPYRIGRVAASERHGRIVRLTSTEGDVGYGEVTPLPGLHTESLDAVDAALARLAVSLPGREFDEFAGLALGVANQVASLEEQTGHAMPSVAFGLETAGMGLFAQAAGTTPAHLLSESPRPRIPVNALFQGGPDLAARRIEEGTFDPYTRVKVKVSGRAIQDERRVLETLCQGLKDGIRLRIDANRSLDLDQAVTLFRGLPPERIEYLEEPLADPSQLADLNSRTGHRIGLDESLLDPSLHYLGRAPWVGAWVIKAARIGHWQRIAFLDRQAAHYGAVTVLSSCLETGLGLWAQVQMAAALPGDVAAAGLATDALLEMDVVEPRYDSTGGALETAAWQGRLAPRIHKALGFSGAP